jgi:Zinc-finger associated domain (zf-AD)
LKKKSVQPLKENPKIKEIYRTVFKKYCHLGTCLLLKFVIWWVLILFFEFFLNEISTLTMNLCRLCGEEKSPLELSVELNDITSANWSYRDLIELHTRVSLKANKLLPQSICEECRALIDRFVEFSSHIQKVQEGFDEEQLEVSEVKECFVQVDQLMVTSIMEEQEEDEAEWEKPLRKKRTRVRNLNITIYYFF